MKPKTFLDKEFRQNSKYFFISYSHKDSGLVYDILDRVFEKDVNFWYDKELNEGDIWNETAEKILTSPHCCGAIVFLSKNSVSSNAVNEEISIINTLRNEREFRALPILVGGDTILKIVGAAIAENPNDISLLKNITQFSNLLVNNTVIHHTYNNGEETTEVIAKLARVEDVLDKAIIDTRESNLMLLKAMWCNKKTILELGKYKFDEKESESAVSWVLINQQKNIYYFISEYAIDFVRVNGISSVIKNLKNQLVDKPFVMDIMPLDEEFLNRNIDKMSNSLPTDYADKNRQQNLRAFWIKNLETNKYNLFNSKNAKINRVINYENINAGIRLVLKINNDLITTEDN